MVALVVSLALYFRLSVVLERERDYLSSLNCYDDSSCREIVDVLVVDSSPSRYTTTAPITEESYSEVTVSAYSLDVVEENGKTLKLEIPLEAPAEKIALNYEVNILAYPDKKFIRDFFSDNVYAEVEIWEGKATYIITQGWAIPTFSHPTIIARKTEENFRDWNILSSIVIGFVLLIAFGEKK